jgi:hypothetical protein
VALDHQRDDSAATASCPSDRGSVRSGRDLDMSRGAASTLRSWRPSPPGLGSVPITRHRGETLRGGAEVSRGQSAPSGSYAVANPLMNVRALRGGAEVSRGQSAPSGSFRQQAAGLSTRPASLPAPFSPAAVRSLR